MRIIGNLLWLVLSGIEMAIAYVVAGVLSLLLIVGSSGMDVGEIMAGSPRAGRV
jgi:uncharacterized membrane protein YccF (DUF307 family)